MNRNNPKQGKFICLNCGKFYSRTNIKGGELTGLCGDCREDVRRASKQEFFEHEKDYLTEVTFNDTDDN